MYNFNSWLDKILIPFKLHSILLTVCFNLVCTTSDPFCQIATVTCFTFLLKLQVKAMQQATACATLQYYSYAIDACACQKILHGQELRDSHTIAYQNTTPMLYCAVLFAALINSNITAHYNYIYVSLISANLFRICWDILHSFVDSCILMIHCRLRLEIYAEQGKDTQLRMTT